jgi:type IV secretory pathway TraG/TraD family ATPase VirD4
MSYPSLAQTQLIAQTETSTNPVPQTINLDSVKGFISSTNGLLLLICVAGFGFLFLLEQGTGGKKKNKLASGRWCSSKDKASARKIARSQIAYRKRNALTLYINCPTITRKGNPLKDGKLNLRFANEGRTVYVPDVQRGVSVIGAPGVGKTFTVIDPLIRSTINQGFPLVLYDFKYPTQSERVAAFAAEHGYEVRIFAPGFPESDICNPLDFMESELDSLMARQMATVLNRNFKLSSQATDDPFFSNAGDQLIEATLMLAKSMPHPDIMTAFSILNAQELIDRLQNNDLNYWIKVAFMQLISTAQSEKTVASIISTASLIFTRFMKAGILPAFCGKTSIPLDLQGKQLLIFGMDRERRDVVGPLLATVLHMIVTRNVVKKRTDPLVLALDELPTLYLPNLVQWLNENREDGLACILGYQTILQLEKAYGKETAGAIFGGTASKFVFNPQNNESARLFSDYLGDEELRYKSKSRNTGGGKSSVTRSEQEKTRKLFASDQFLKLPPFHCIYINPAYGQKEEASVPQRLKIKVSPKELKAMDSSQGAWINLRQNLIKRNILHSPTEADLKTRMDTFDAMFPIAKQQTEMATAAQQLINWGTEKGML